ncbi:outer membrane lipoprotein chaperone LolA [Rhodoferax sp.]|uniref:outer membrane lipoprotein chaperone LolA n=1 Tax=Rhodoferax sp. TaxID=50421 RepID=UPI00275C5D19|nr:outer membrane lipoprotein chaperone LolA [Rhodoferax sp.]
MKTIIAAILIAVCQTSAWADGLKNLEDFVKNTKSGRSDFTQVVTAPAKAGQSARSKTSSGTFEFLRPNRFKFVYQKPFEQTIVADGQTLWLYDVDLKQVTARQQNQALGATPAALIASAPDLRALQADFTLSAAPQADGLQWVLALPKAKDGQLQSVRVGFRAGALAALEILDSFGQNSVLSFGTFQANAALDASHFQFKPPPGADVIRQ